MWYVPIVSFGIFFVIFLVIVINIFRSHKHVGDTMQDMINTVSAYAEKQMEDTMEQLNDNLKEETKTCEYCGSTIPANSGKCNACGAKVKK